MLPAPSPTDEFTVADKWELTAAARGSHPCLVQIPDERSAERSLSFSQVDSSANQVASWAASKGMKKGDAVALFMENCPEFVISWVGLAKQGLVTAWINNTIKLQPLVHSIRVAAARAVLFGAELADVVEAVHGDLAKEGIESFCLGASPAFCRGIDVDIAAQPSKAPAKLVRKGVQFKDTMCYIYTSGTTGLPKAAVIHHKTYVGTGGGFGELISEAAPGVLYGSGMPLYHSAGGMVGMGATVATGITYLIRRKFSASSWLGDIRTYRVTAAQYIGELARYVLATPEQADDGDNPLKLCTGNGLRPEYWERFQVRFGIDFIFEFYGATESTGGFSNMTLLANIKQGKKAGVGSVGRLNDPRVRFVRYDVDADEYVRGPDGFCIPVEANEPGEMLVRETDGELFRGYTDEAASKKKLVKDVFEKGDLYFRTGDLLRFDKDGWVYFVDRIGDTFRWKGENVSTAEVATELAKFAGVDEVNVYGVLIPNNEDGRAGMCAMVMEDASEERLAAFYRHAAASLPPYAVPLFLRIQPAMMITGTFKHQKVQLRNEGFDPSKVKDVLYYLDSGKYKMLDAEAYRRITQGGPRSRL
mmetsp:Transcript_82619/g.256638  ORF Transcript_82619/g.256638 Transcript_82619/m.256638 type:complete len:589 (+) Transcript_82619:114-1880(+)